MARLAVVGTGYVGLVSGAMFAEKGHQVTCVDKDEFKIERLNRGEMPIYEPGLEEIVHHGMRSGRLSFTTDLKDGVWGADATFIAVGTPYDPTRGRFAPEALYAVVDGVKKVLGQARLPHAVVIKSTITPDMFLEARKRLVAGLDEIAFRNLQLVSCPEFLREGRAVDDTRYPDRIVIGATDADAARFMVDLHRPFCVRSEGKNIHVMDPVSATLVKLGSNAHRASRIALMNELARVCDTYGGDIAQVRLGIGADKVIGDQFLYAGPGYGGSCFPKDAPALAGLIPGPSLIAAVHDSNEAHKHYLARRVQEYYGESIAVRTLGLWGLAFKAGTDDVRESPAIVIAQDLLAAGAQLRVYDERAMETARAVLGDQVTYCDTAYDAARADALVIATEWDEFKAPDLARLRESLRDRVIFDGRNILDIKAVEDNGMRYYGMGRNGHGRAFSHSSVGPKV